MCGIAGIWHSKPVGEDVLERESRLMGESMVYRGPDAAGSWVDGASSIALTHRRLSILDLSVTGAQPMRSQCGRYVITYNGECYNFPEMRRDLESSGCSFRGDSDTEVVLEACAKWGVQRCLDRLNGMFAFALWDTQTQELVLGRDRLGIKPLYYGWSSGVFWFGSELKALRAIPEIDRNIDRESLGLFFKYGYIPAPHSIFEGFRKLPSAHYLVVSSPSEPSSPECYWSRTRDFGRSKRTTFNGSKEEAVDELDRLLRASIRRQMVSDVPLGAFLSGGIDSSTVVAMMQDQSDRPVKTFTIGFDEAKYNEANFASEVGNFLGTEHTDMYLSSSEARDIVPMLGGIFDEPFADPSQIPTYAVSRMTREHVTVSLSGDGGDELFAGYRNYALSANRLRKLERVPAVARRALAAVAGSVSEQRWDQLLSGQSSEALTGHKVHKYASILREGNLMKRNDLMVSRWYAPGQIVRSYDEAGSSQKNGFDFDEFDPIELMAAVDLQNYLPEDILTKVDRASMAVSLESRVPILDHEVVEFALDLPLSYKRCEGETKWVLREVLSKYIPKEMFDRPKQGFSVPTAEWIRGPLNDWATSLIERADQKHGDLLDTSAIRRKWDQHNAGDQNWEKLLWPVLIFEQWAEANLD